MNWILTNSLWLVGFGLMLASSGIDGAYMAQWMPDGWQWLGYVLNSTADVSGMALTYFFGRLQQDRAKAKRRLAVIVLGGELVGVFFSWFFGWRQLLIVLPPVEPVDYRWIAPIAAAFIPLLLAFIGYAESLLAGKFESSEKPLAQSVVKSEPKPEPVNISEKPVITIPASLAPIPAPLKTIELSEYRSLIAGLNGGTPRTAEAVNQWLAVNGYEQKPVSTARRWAKVGEHTFMEVG